MPRWRLRFSSVHFGLASIVASGVPGACSEYASRTCRRTHVTELFNRAAGQLRDPKLEVRLAAIYVLREVAKDFPDFSNPIFELLQAYLRVGDIDYGDEQPPVDVQAIIKLLRSRLEIPDA